MNDDTVLQFDDTQMLGRVASVDTSRVIIDAENSELVTTIGVGNLVAIQGAIASEYLIGITERVTRSLTEGVMGDEGREESEIVLAPRRQTL